jgi:phosphate-selective porin
MSAAMKHRGIAAVAYSAWRSDGRCSVRASARRGKSQSKKQGKNMCSPKPWCVLLIAYCIASGPLVLAQSASSTGNAAPSASKGGAASEDEVQQLRREVADLKALIQRLAPAGSMPATGPAAVAAAPPAANAPAPATRADVDALQNEVSALQKKASEVPPATAGWNGEHFFLRSSDGTFTIMPVGYVDGQYSVYGNSDGAPPDSFSITRARFGFQGNYGKQLDYGLMIETISSPTVRDAYLDFKPWKAFNIMGGVFKVPFSMEVGSADTAVEFYNRSIISVLYPDAGGAFRAPGIEFHGEFARGAMEYWAGLYNGQGLLATGTTNEPEVVGRLRFSPWKNSDNGVLQGLAFGGSYEHSESKGLAGEQSFSGVMNDGTYTFFPQFRINGNVERYNGFFSWLDGPVGIRGEYAHLAQDRTNIGSIANGGIGFNSLPTVEGEGYYVSATYFLTGESEPLNALPRVRHPVIGPASPGESGAPGWGAWALKFRYSKLQGDAPGATCDATTTPACPITPVIAAPFYDHTDQYTFGVNWYLNYWVLMKSEVNLDQLKNPSVQGILPRNYYVFLETLQFRF